MTEDQVRELEYIKGYIPEGSYSILQPAQWDRFSKTLASCGATLVKEIESRRDLVRELKVPFLPFQFRKQLARMNADFDVTAKDFDLFYDASMRWLKSIINKNEYKEYQLLEKKYVENLTMHCCQALDYLANLVSSKRSDYYHYQALFLSVLAVFIAVLAIIVSIIV